MQGPRGDGLGAAAGPEQAFASRSSSCKGAASLLVRTAGAPGGGHTPRAALQQRARAGAAGHSPDSDHGCAAIRAGGAGVADIALEACALRLRRSPSTGEARLERRSRAETGEDCAQKRGREVAGAAGARSGGAAVLRRQPREDEDPGGLASQGVGALRTFPGAGHARSMHLVGRKVSRTRGNIHRNASTLATSTYLWAWRPVPRLKPHGLAASHVVHPLVQDTSQERAGLQRNSGVESQQQPRLLLAGCDWLDA
mmetsp:Transcript_63318/g.185115  ORF Transcript_63318/g.185115 Transcript_63318/m.185115 type:complete len:255 (-) Transcript_63318:121-885(-)